MTVREQRRLAALHECRPLDAPAGDELDAVVRVAAAWAISMRDNPQDTVRDTLPDA